MYPRDNTLVLNKPVSIVCYRFKPNGRYKRRRDSMGTAVLIPLQGHTMTGVPSCDARQDSPEQQCQS